MSVSKNKLVALSWIAHLVIALILCNLTSHIIKRVLLLVCIALICGIQIICIRKIPGEKWVETKKREDDCASP